MNDKNIAIVVGSIRKNSMSETIGLIIKDMFPSDYKIEFLDIGKLPLYNPDMDGVNNAIKEYKDFREQLKKFRGFIFITPEHNRSMPAAVKNALDIGSNPFGENMWAGKTSLVISQSHGAIGGFGANHHIRQVLVVLDVMTVQQPEIYIGNSRKLIKSPQDANKDTLAFLQTGIDAFVDLTDKLSIS